MKISEYLEEKIFYTQNIFKWMKVFSTDKNVIVITPLTKISDLLDISSSSFIYKELLEMTDGDINKIIRQSDVVSFLSQINKLFNLDVVEMDLNFNKIIKAIFKISEEHEISESFIKKYLMLLNKHTNKMITILISDFNKIESLNLNMVNVHYFTNKIQGYVNWSNIEQLVILDKEEPFEVLDRDKFLSWLELKTRTVLTIKDLNSYFDNEINFNSFLIEKALRSIE